MSSEEANGLRRAERRMAMRKIVRAGSSLFAVLVLAVLAVTPALADEFLVNGEAFTGALAAELEGLVTLTNYASAGSTEILTQITCSGILIGTIEGAKGEITAVLSLEKTEVGTLNSEDTEKTGLNCEATLDAGSTTDCQAGTLATVWVVGINLQLGDFVNVELLLNETMISVMMPSTNNLSEVVGLDAECTLLDGLKIANECTGGSGESALANNTLTSPPSVLLKTESSAVATRGNCTLTGEHSGTALITEGSTWVVGSELEHLETAIN
jgi:hypothetical protein